MSRLIAFGCSFTFGQGLIDIYPSSNKSSRFAWPELLGNKLKRSVINRGKPGIGNLEILNRVLTTKFEPSDIVVIMWSQFVRHDFFRYDLIPIGSRIHYEEFLKYNPIEEKWWIDNNRARNWLTIHQCSLYLQSINIPFVSFMGIVGHNDTLPYPKLEIPNLLTDINVSDWFVDRALDAHEEGKGHPGLESHKLIANLIYDKIAQ